MMVLGNLIARYVMLGKDDAIPVSEFATLIGDFLEALRAFPIRLPRGDLGPLVKSIYYK